MGLTVSAGLSHPPNDGWAVAGGALGLARSGADSYEIADVAEQVMRGFSLQVTVLSTSAIGRVAVEFTVARMWVDDKIADGDVLAVLTWDEAAELDALPTTCAVAEADVTCSAAIDWDGVRALSVALVVLSPIVVDSGAAVEVADQSKDRAAASPGVQADSDGDADERGIVPKADGSDVAAADGTATDAQIPVSSGTGEANASRSDLVPGSDAPPSNNSPEIIAVLRQGDGVSGWAVVAIGMAVAAGVAGSAAALRLLRGRSS